MERELLKQQVEKTSEWIQKLLTEFVELCENENLTNEQFYINFEDKLNELSTKDHNSSPQT